MTSSQKSRNLCVDCEISISRWKLTKYLQLHNGFDLFRGFQPLNAVFPSIWVTKVKIWTKSENPRWWPPVTSFICLLLPWKPIRHHVVLLNWKYKWSLFYFPNFKSVGWILSKVEGGGGGSDWPPVKASCNYFSRRLLGLSKKNKTGKLS